MEISSRLEDRHGYDCVRILFRYSTCPERANDQTARGRIGVPLPYCLQCCHLGKAPEGRRCEPTRLRGPREKDAYNSTEIWETQWELVVIAIIPAVLPDESFCTFCFVPWRFRDDLLDHVLAKFVAQVNACWVQGWLSIMVTMIPDKQVRRHAIWSKQTSVWNSLLNPYLPSKHAWMLDCQIRR